MTTSQDVAVTYNGTDDPFKDRIYRSGLTFAPGQTRLVPATLAQRFLRHSDVFKSGKVEKAAPPQQDQRQQQDDTKQVLEQQQQVRQDQRQQEDARFELLDYIDSMDRKSLIDWAHLNYKQKIHHNTSIEKARDMAKGFIDQYGMPA